MWRRMRAVPSGKWGSAAAVSIWIHSATNGYRWRSIVLVEGKSVLSLEREALLLDPASQGGVRRHGRPALIGPPGQCEMDDVKPGEDSRDDRPKNRAVARSGKGHGQDRAKSDPGLGCGVRAEGGDLREDHGWIGKDRPVELAKFPGTCKAVFAGFGRWSGRIRTHEILVKEVLD